MWRAARQENSHGPDTGAGADVENSLEDVRVHS